MLQVPPLVLVQVSHQVQIQVLVEALVQVRLVDLDDVGVRVPHHLQV